MARREIVIVHARRGAKFGAQLLAGVLIAVLTFLWVVTQTDWGRDRIRLYGVQQLADRVHGKVRIGEVHGDLLTGATLVDVVITDSADAPFLRADTIQLRYSMRALVQKHLVFQDVRLVNPIIVLDQQPGDDWNVSKLFRGDTVVSQGDTVPGFGSWVRFEDVEMVGGDVTIRRAWSPGDDLDDAARSRAIERALAPDSRENVIAIAGGHQAVSTFHEIDAHFPLIRFADPDSASRVIDVSRLSMTALPFRPPAAEIQGMTGRLVITEDTLGLSDVVLRLPGSVLRLEGNYAFGSPSGANLRLVGGPLALADLRFVRPSLPEGGGSIDVTVTQVGGATRLAAKRLDIEAEGAHVRGSVDFETGSRHGGHGGGLRIHGSDLAFTGLDTRLVERLVPEVDVPIDAVLAGSVRLSGTPDALTVDGESEIRERNGAVSHVVADGTVIDAPVGQIARDLRLRFDPLQLSLVRQATGGAADIPVGGVLTGSAILDGPLAELLTVDADLTHVDRATGRSRLLAQGGLRLRDATARNLRVRMEPLRAALVRAFVPGFPLGGVFTGRATLNGALRSRFTMDADVTHERADGAPSHVLAVGDLEVGPTVVARGLRLQLDPLQVSTVRAFAPRLALDGTVTGRVTLDGALGREVVAALDLTHTGSTGTSSLVGDAHVAFARGISSFDLDLEASPLALATVGRFVPVAGLRGIATGPISLRGTPERAELDARLDVVGGGRIDARGTVGIGARAAYDVVAQLTGFDAAAVTSRAPGTALTGTVAVRGVGTDPATMDARIVASLVDSRLPGAPRLDSTRVDARLSGGLATIERGEIRLGSARADLEGSFGLVADRSGTLTYRIELDSLDQIGDMRPAPASARRVVVSRPLVRARELGRARVDSAETADQQLVERMATGKTEVEEVTLDTAATAIASDSVSGSVVAEGSVTGNVHRFDAQGTAELANVVWNGNEVRSGSVTYTITDAPTPGLSVQLDAQLGGVRAGGFAFDSATASIEHAGGRREGTGRADVSVFQDEARDYRLTADYVLALDRKELVIANAALRFDSTTWQSTQPGAVRWAGNGVELDHIELVDGRGGRLFADGRLPTEGSGDLNLSVSNLQLGDLAALVQDTLQTRGILTMDARFRGTLRAPVMEATLALDSASRTYGRTVERIPDVRASFAYGSGEIRGEAQFLDQERLLLSATGRMPLNLAFQDRTGPLLIDGPVALDLRADSFPLQVLPSLSPTVTDVAGRVRGEVRVRGTRAAPELAGNLELTQGRALIPDAGVTLTDMAGAFRLADDVLHIDSLNAKSGGGPVTMTGSVELAELDRPVFDLNMRAEEALLLANERGEVTGDADLRITGDLELLHVRGDLHVREGEIQAPEPEGEQRATRLDDPALLGIYEGLGVAEALRPRGSFLRRVDLDVGVRIERDTWLRNSVMNVEVYTPSQSDALRVTTDPITHDLLLEGVIHADRGDYTFAGREFELTTGSVTFIGGRPDPLLQLSARHEVPRRGREALVILITIGGTLSEPKLSLSSNVQPPIAESDLLSYLAFGRESGSLLTGEGSAIVGDALGGLGVLAEQQLAGLGLGALTQGIFSNLERRGTAAGLDVFRVRPRALPDELNFAGYGNILKSLDIQAGEYLNSELFLSAQAQPGSGGVPSLKLEWKRPDGFSWVSTWENRFLPPVPSLDIVDPTRTRAFGTFLLWERRF